MRKLLPLVAVLLLLCLVVTVSAHPGRTDGAGGHWNQSTGEYHYHHGYGEHQHSDMDGDGDLDCPYEFKASASLSSNSESSKSSDDILSDIYDNISESSSGPSKTYYELWAEAAKTYGIEERQSVTTYPTYDWADTKVFERKPQETSATLSDYDQGSMDGHYEGFEEGKKYVRRASTPVIIILSIISVVLYAVLHFRSKESEEQYQDMKQENQNLEKNNQNLEKNNQNLSNDLESLKKQNTDLHSQVYRLTNEKALLEDAREKYQLITLSQKSLIDRNTKLEALMMQYLAADPAISEALDKIPKGTLLSPDGFPVEGVVTKEEPYGDFTVYVSRYGSAYHRERWCSNTYMDPVCIFQVQNSHQPCKRCAAYWQVPAMPQWYADILDEVKKPPRLMCGTHLFMRKNKT